MSDESAKYMLDFLSFVLSISLCLLIPVGILALAIWAIRRLSGRSQKNTTALKEHDRLLQFDLLVQRWMAEGRLPPELGQQVRDLLQEESTGGNVPFKVPFPQAPPATQAGPVLPVDQPETMPTTPAVVPSVAAPATAATATAATATAAAPTASVGAKLWPALLAIRTRMLLLLLGSFLVLISALILVVYNWASFPPILQFALLASVCGSFWVGGAWVQKRAGLETAGIGLQAVGGVLVPVVAFALARPGLLDLPIRFAWLLASGLSLPIYALATWRLRHWLFLGAGCLAGISSTLAITNIVVGWHWYFVALVLVCISYLQLATWLARHDEADLARVPYLVAHSCVPVILAFVLVARIIPPSAQAAALWAGFGFYLFAAWQDDLPRWFWVALICPPLAIVASLRVFAISSLWWPLALAVVALAYLGAGLVLEQRRPRFMVPSYVGAVVLSALTILTLVDSDWAQVRWTLPVLFVGSLGTILAYHQGYFAWLNAQRQRAVGVAGLVLAGVLLPVWLCALLDLTLLTWAQQGIIVLLLAFGYTAAARWYPGRLHPAYKLALNTLAVGIAVAASMLTLLDSALWVPGMLVLTTFWIVQAVVRPAQPWPFLVLGNLLLTGVASLAQPGQVADLIVWVYAGLFFSILYVLGATALRETRWRDWMWASMGWGGLVGVLTLAGVLCHIVAVEQVQINHIVVISLLLSLCLVVSWRWKQAWLGYPAAGLVALVVLLAATRGFFTGWQPALPDYAYVVCGLTFGLFIVGQGLRRGATRYAYPYEIVGYGLLTAAPLLATGHPSHATFTWGSMTVLYGLAAWRYRAAWAVFAAFVALDMGVLRGAAWRIQSAVPENGGLLLLGTAWLQGLVGLFLHRRERLVPQTRWTQWHWTAAYAAAALSGVGALVIAHSNSLPLALVAFGLTVLLAVLATIEHWEILAVGSVVCLAVTYGSLCHLLDLPIVWSLAWGEMLALAVCLVGWGVERFTQHPAWRRPLLYTPLAGGSILVVVMLVLGVPLFAHVASLTFTLVTFALLLTTLAVREREPVYGYVAGAALVGALLCYFYGLELRNVQWYVVPSAIYLFTLAEGLRRFQGRGKVSQVIETGALLLLLSTTLLQSLEADARASTFYVIIVAIEALLLLGYGTLRKLRVPFVGGFVAFVLSILWLGINPLWAENKWIVLGLIGLVMLGMYVVMEQRQEQLRRAGRVWAERMQQWE